MSMRRDLFWTGVAQFFYLLFQFASSVVVARILSPYDVGIFTIALATVGLLAVFQEFGLYGFIVKEKELNAPLLRTVFTVNVGLSVLLSVLVLAVGFFGSMVWHEGGIRRVLIVVAICPVLNALSFLPETRLQRDARFKTLSIITISRTLLSQSAAIIFALQGSSYMSLAYAQVIAAVFSLLAFNIVGREFSSFQLGLSDWRRVTGYGVRMLAISGLSSASDRMSDFLIGKIAGLSALGFYSRGSSLNNLVWENIHLVSGKVVFVDLAQTHRSGKSIATRYLKVNDVNTVLLWPAFLGLAIVSGPFIRLVYGERWVPAAHALALISLGSMVYVSLSMTWDIFVLGGRTKEQSYLEGIRALLSTLIFAVGCRFGLTGVGAARLATAVVANELYRPLVQQITQTRLSDYKSIYPRNLVITAAAVLPSEIIMALFRWSEFTPLMVVIAGIVVGVGLWVLAILVLGHPLKQEILAVKRAVSLRLGFGAKTSESSSPKVVTSIHFED